MMDCKHIDELLVEYLYQELDPSQVERFEAHLQSCPRCAGELASFERTRAIVQEMPEMEPPARIDERILAEAARAAQTRPAGAAEEPGFWQRIADGLRLLVMHPAMTAAVTLVLVLGVSFYVYRSSSPRSVREEPDSPYTPEVDRRLPSGSATISVREQAPATKPDPVERRAEGAQVQAAEPLAKEVPTHPKGMQRAVAKRVAMRRAKGAPSEDERSLRAGGRRGLMPETANVLGKANAAGDTNTAPSPATAVPAAEPQKDLPKVAKAPKADDAPNRASKSRDRESVDKSEGFAQKKKNASGLDDGLLGKGGGGSAGRAKTESKIAAAPRKPFTPKPTPVASQQARPGKAWSGKSGGKGGYPNDDLDSLGDEAKAAYKGQLASKIKSSSGASGAAEAMLGDKARAGGRCDQALAHYNRAITLDAKQLPALAGKVRACAAQLAKSSDVPLLKATKSYPALAGLLVPELERARRARAERTAAETQQVRGPRKAKARPAAKSVPAKADAAK